MIESRLDVKGETVAEMRGDIETIKGQMGAGAVAFGEIRSCLAAIKTGQDRMNEQITSLIAQENQRKGREGVWAAIVNSKGVAWLVAALAAVGAWFAGQGDIPK